MAQDNQVLEVENRLKQLATLVEEAEAVKKTVESDGWELVIGPLLDKMIIDVLGQKQNGRWHNGSIDEQTLDEPNARLLCAYKRALTDFHNRIFVVIDSLESYHKEYNELQAFTEESDIEPLATGYDNVDVKSIE